MDNFREENIMEKQITKKEIRNMIYEVRGEQVILDRNLSYLLDIETRVLNQQVKRNLELFSQAHYFQMNEEEFLNWKSQFVMSDNDKLGLRRAPYVFTKEGILTLDKVLKSKIGKEVIRTILEVFDSLNNTQILLKSPEIQGNIVSRIYEIRGKQVMLDSDLAKLYKVETKRINEAVRNNLEKFPERFSWKLTE